MVRARTALGVIAAGLLLAGAADAANLRRPDPATWAQDLAGWRGGTATKSEGVIAPSDSGSEAAMLQASDEPLISGAAYLLSADGVWLTAKHLVSACKAIHVETTAERGGQLQIQKVESAAVNDLAIIRTAPPKAVGAAFMVETPDEGTGEGFSFGFPDASPGGVYGRFMGEAKVRWIGSGRGEDAAWVWAEKARIPNFEGLEDIAGGIALDRDGIIVGMVSAGSTRRGRVFTTPPGAVRDLMAKAGITPPPLPRPHDRPTRMTEANWPAYGRQLILDGRIARVVCESRTAAHGGSNSPRRYR